MSKMEAKKSSGNPTPAEHEKDNESDESLTKEFMRDQIKSH